MSLLDLSGRITSVGWLGSKIQPLCVGERRIPAASTRLFFSTADTGTTCYVRGSDILLCTYFLGSSQCLSVAVSDTCIYSCVCCHTTYVLCIVSRCDIYVLSNLNCSFDPSCDDYTREPWTTPSASRSLGLPARAPWQCGRALYRYLGTLYISYILRFRTVS